MKLKEQFIDMLIDHSERNEKLAGGKHDHVSGKILGIKQQILENQEKAEKYDDLMKANSEIVQNNISHTQILQENKQLKENLEAMTKHSDGKIINGRCEKCHCLIANPNEIIEEDGIIYHAFSCEGKNG